MLERIEKWIRWQIAILLDRRRDTCWPDLATWALFPGSHDVQAWADFAWILSLPKRGYCLREGPYTYCGKCDHIQALEIAEGLHLRRVLYSLST